MNNEKLQFLNQRVWPHRLNITETGWLLGFTAADITILITQKLLIPIGQPSQNSTKYFATVQVKKLHDNVPWLNKATAVLNQHWRMKNAGRKKAEVTE